MGARPIALVNALRFGDPSHPKTRSLVAGVVGGIGGYGNCVGVPTVGGETQFHKGYNGNILVNAMAVGLADQDKIFYSRGAEPGNADLLCGFENRPRWHPRRDNGLCRIRLRAMKRSAPPCRSATPSPKSC